MNKYTNQEEWTLMQQRKRKSRSQSLPQSALGLEIGRRGSGVLNPAGSKKVANYINKIPQLIQLQHQNPPCVKLNCNETLVESPSPELKKQIKKREGNSQQSRSTPYHDENLMSHGKDGETWLSNMSTLQLPDSGNSSTLR
jgi:hypothetical protein